MKIVIAHSDSDEAAKQAVLEEIRRQGYTLQTHKMGIVNGQIIVMERDGLERNERTE